jgi:CRP-like cAMP-binding protein
MSEFENVEIKTLSQGDSFGELALIENKKCSATITCKENTYFATLDKEFFDQALSDYQN